MRYILGYYGCFSNLGLLEKGFGVPAKGFGVDIRQVLT